MTIAEVEREQILERLRECAEAHAEGRTAERARIVAWLYRYADVLRGRHTSADGHGYVEHAASLIEAGVSPEDVA